MNLERDGAPDIPDGAVRCCETCDRWVPGDGCGICAHRAESAVLPRGVDLDAMAASTTQGDHSCGRWEPWRGL